MKTRTRRQLAALAAGRFFRQYADRLEEPLHDGRTPAMVYGELLKLEGAALNGVPHPDRVDAVMGNKSWTRCTCDECDDDVEVVVDLGSDEQPVCLCRRCVRAALTLFEVTP